MAAAFFLEGGQQMINAERILRTLDERLDHEVLLVIYGRAAVALGFENPPAALAESGYS